MTRVEPWSPEELGDAADRPAVGLIEVILWVGIITVDGQVAGVGIRVSTL